MVITLIEDALRIIKRGKKPLEVRNHKTITGGECYRLINAEKTPVCNISKPVAASLLRRGIISGLPAAKPETGKLF